MSYAFEKLAENVTDGDPWTASLMAELRKVRSDFLSAYDRAWRRERMYRYVYWLSERKHPSFNLVGSRRDEDILHEIQLWKELDRRSVDDDEVVEEITRRLESRFAMTLAQATAAATFPGLAASGLPLWNNMVGCLLPQSLGSLRISASTDYETRAPGEGIGYSYRQVEPDVDRNRADLYLYTSGEQGLGTGIRDARVEREANRSWAGVVAALPGWRIPPDRQIGPAVETLYDPYGRECAFVGVGAIMERDGTDQAMWTTLSLTTLNGAFLKVRYTARLDGADASDLKAEMSLFNMDVASFCCHFAPQSDPQP